jgi:hypothetical protein
MSELSINPVSVSTSNPLQSLSLMQAFGQMGLLMKMLTTAEANDPNPEDKALLSQLQDLGAQAFSLIGSAIQQGETTLTPQQQGVMQNLANQVNSLIGENPNAGGSVIQDADLLFYAMQSLA